MDPMLRSCARIAYVLMPLRVSPSFKGLTWYVSIDVLSCVIFCISDILRLYTFLLFAMPQSAPILSDIRLAAYPHEHGEYPASFLVIPPTI